MFARIVTFPLKAGSTLQYTEAIEKGVIPLIRTHKGFVDEVALVTADGTIGLGISFWDTKENAEAYNRSGYREVLNALDKVIAGPAQLQFCEVTNSTVHKIKAALAA